MSSPTKPTVLVHGAFAESASRDDVVVPLTQAGHPVVAAAIALRSPAADAASASDLVRSIDGPVVLVGHSYIAGGSGRLDGEQLTCRHLADVAMEYDDRPTLVLHEGDPSLIPPGIVHNARNTGTGTSRMLSTYVVDESQPLATRYD